MSNNHLHEPMEFMNQMTRRHEPPLRAHDAAACTYVNKQAVAEALESAFDALNRSETLAVDAALLGRLQMFAEILDATHDSPTNACRWLGTHTMLIAVAVGSIIVHLFAMFDRHDDDLRAYLENVFGAEKTVTYLAVANAGASAAEALSVLLNWNGTDVRACYFAYTMFAAAPTSMIALKNGDLNVHYVDLRAMADMLVE